MGTAPADLFSLRANMLPDQGMDVVPLLAVAVAEHQMSVEETSKGRKSRQFLQGDLMAVGNPGQPERVVVWNRQEFVLT